MHLESRKQAPPIPFAVYASLKGSMVVRVCLLVLQVAPEHALHYTITLATAASMW